jgi:hypothetical protein
MILMTLELPIKEKMTAFDWFLIMSGSFVEII